MIINGDCFVELIKMENNSVDAVVTDPPYGLKFMGKHWDYDVPAKNIWEECLRVLKPGGHLLSFFGTRTYHRGVSNIEDAGFEIRDQIQWLYGSGFPKSYNIKDGDFKGWGSALKPANEPICVARKPLEKGLTLAQNIVKWGTGALNIDGSRIEFSENEPDKRIGTGFISNGGDASNNANDNQVPNKKYVQMYKQGRWPANIILDETAAEMLDEQSGNLKAAGSVSGNEKSKPAKNTYGEFKRKEWLPHNDSGGASRFFYVAKASKRERNAGLEAMPLKESGGMSGTKNKPLKTGSGNERDILNQNHHPTVKPIKLMEYLCKLITPPQGIVLDPFTGSGSTGVAAKNLGFKFIGIEKEKEYCEIAQKRIEFKQKF